MNLGVIRGVTTVELIDVITSKENLNRAYKKVVANKGASGVDGVAVEELGDYIRENKDMDLCQVGEKTFQRSRGMKLSYKKLWVLLVERDMKKQNLRKKLVLVQHQLQSWEKVPM